MHFSIFKFPDINSFILKQKISKSMKLVFEYLARVLPSIFEDNVSLSLFIYFSKIIHSFLFTSCILILFLRFTKTEGLNIRLGLRRFSVGWKFGQHFLKVLHIFVHLLKFIIHSFLLMRSLILMRWLVYVNRHINYWLKVIINSRKL